MAMALAMAASSALAMAFSAPTPSSSSSSPPLLPKQVTFSNPSLPPPISSSPHNPSLPFANLLWFKGSYNAQIFVGENEPPDSVVRRFRRAVMQAGVIAECRRRRFRETPQDVAKRKRQNARRKPRRFFPRALIDQRKEPSKVTAAADDYDYKDDNWEYDGVADRLL